ncbi:MAG: hypothetical protein IJ568_05945 [Bacilli bacterium]|nr:hypothetical protein [Bacilli bacterium]
MKKTLRISFILNIIIFVFVVIATIFMFTGFKFMKTNSPLLTKSNIEMFKFFTVDSNILMGIVSLVFLIYDYMFLKGMIKKIPKLVYILKLTATVGVSLTFLTTVFYLAPFAGGDFLEYFKNSNLFFHLFVPVLSIITFIFFEKTDNLSMKSVLIGIIPMVIYAIFYLVNVLVHIKNGKVDFVYDWYLFAKGGKSSIIFVFIFMILITYLISYVLWLLNRSKLNVKE